MPKSACDPLTASRLSVLLGRLDPDASQAAEKLLRLRRRLNAYFQYNHCAFPDELSDQALDILAKKLSDTEIETVEAYLMAIAQNLVRKAWARRKDLPVTLEAVSDRPALTCDPLRSIEEGQERRIRAGCLEECLACLPDESRRLFVECQSGDKRERIERKNQWAARLGLSAVALRVRLHRIRLKLEGCVTGCLRTRETPHVRQRPRLESRDLG